MKQDLFDNYINSISSKYSHEETSELGYRTDFEILLKGIFESIKVTRFDHDSRAQQGNKPDFVVMKNDIPILYIETKDIGVSLDKIEKSEQMSRYFGYANLVLTDYLEFRFYRNGLPYGEPIMIAEYNKKDRTITPISRSYEDLAQTLLDFAQSYKEPIRSGIHLSQVMAGKALRIRNNVYQFLITKTDRNIEINHIYEVIKKLLVHDLTEETFSDMYAQTVVYGLFIARYYDESPSDFNRREARDLIPQTNPFLQHFFDHIVGPNFDKRLEYIVNELCEVFSHADVKKLMKDYYQKDLWGNELKRPDPVIHFYEDFLKEYDPVLRKKMGAYYTPLPVVNFITQSVDEILKKDFALVNGLADTTKTVTGLHRVQILDPAVGTGTFISSVIRIIYQKLLSTGQKGRWHQYVHNDLLPRIYGFEIMMVPYTIAHLKLAIAFKETEFIRFYRRLGIYLTNSLEDMPKQQGTYTAFGLAETIARESIEAGIIKNKTPIMVILGNPPYSVSSSNKGKWITNLIKDYKIGLNEQNIQPLSDDYIKFIRFAEHFIENNKNGVVAMITNNSFLDGIIHRQMRKHLLKTFDDIYILDLHGNSKKKETTSDGNKDENVFDIQIGVSINIFIRKDVKKLGFGNVFHADLYGKRAYKFDFLNKNNLSSIQWKKLDYSDPYYFFVPKNFNLIEDYEKGFGINELFLIGGSGIKFRKDNLLVKNHYSENSVLQLFHDMEEQDDFFIHSKYNFHDTPDWQLADKRKFFIGGETTEVKPILYRPFDIRFTYYPLDKIAEIIPRGDSRKNLMGNFITGENLGLITSRQQSSFNFQHIFVSKYLIDMCTISSQTKETSYVFPLYLYSENGIKTSNYNLKIVNRIKEIVGMHTPEDIFDYIYAVLHSPSYREKYKEFLKIDFPRVSYPKDTDSFKKLIELGRELRKLHLLESPKVNEFVTTYPESGSDIVDKPIYKNGNVYINDIQYFGNVPKIAWNFYIGGYQPAQKWLKDRKDRQLTNEDIEHYQKVIVTLNETDRIMKEIDKI